MSMSGKSHTLSIPVRETTPADRAAAARVAATFSRDDAELLRFLAALGLEDAA